MDWGVAGFTKYVPFSLVWLLHMYLGRVMVIMTVMTRALPEFWWNFKTFISKLLNLFPSQSNLKASRWA